MSHAHWRITRVQGGDIRTMTAWLTTAEVINAQLTSSDVLYIPRKANRS